MGKMDLVNLWTEAVELCEKQLLPLPSQHAAITFGILQPKLWESVCPFESRPEVTGINTAGDAFLRF